jgi:chitin disaccharide deacetylase
LAKPLVSKPEANACMNTESRRLIVSADDFGLSEAVNEGIEIAHRDGLLSTASLMVAGDAAADAMARARRLPDLRVGLHLVAIEGQATNGASAITDPSGWIGSDQLGLGIRYFFTRSGRAALAREVQAQYRAFARSGLTLDHANAHKHMHLHPTVGRMLIETGAEYGLPAIRIPCEPPAPLGPDHKDTAGAAILRLWTRVLRAQAHRARLRTNDHCFGLAWSGHMTSDRLLPLAANLPPGLSELYFHPAARRDAVIDRLMPDYDHVGELAALTNPQLRSALDHAGVQQVTWDGSHI